MFSWRKRIIDIYIVKEILVPFLAGVAIIGVIMLGSILFQLTQIIFERQIPLGSVIRFMVYQLPDITVQTFPMAILFATISGMGRLNRENEFTALRMGGVSLYRLIMPLLILGVLVSGLTFYINEKVVPWANHEANNIIRYSILKQNMPSVQEDVFFRGPEGRLFYVNKYDDQSNRLEEVVVFNLPVKGSRYPEIVTATTGRIIDNRWQLEDGIIHRYDQNGSLSLEIQFDKMDYVLAEDMQQFFGEQRTTSEMSRERLKKEIDLFARSGINVDSLLVDYHLKLAMPLAALIFILIGTPLSLSSRDSRSAGIVFTIVTVFLYYIILSVARFLGKGGQLAPLLAAWTPNLLFAVFGITLLIWRESWQTLLARLIPVVLIFFLLLSPAVGLAAGDSDAGGETVGEADPAEGVVFRIKQAELLNFSKSEGELELQGDVSADYDQLHIKADRVVVKGSGEFSSLVDSPGEIVLDQGKVSSCDLESPHYYLQAEVLTIYPGDHLTATNVVFRELNGRLPLFYWPYLYISLKENPDRLIPEIGYSGSRGWFIRTTYYYWYKDRLPGEFYLDYYTISGSGGGFKQYLLYEPDLKAALYLYTQENRTALPGLFRWEGGIEIDDQRGAWKTRTDLDYTEYDSYRLFRGDARILFQNKRQNLKLNTLFDSKDYLLTDNKDARELELDLGYRLNLSQGWGLDLTYNRDYLFNPGEQLKRRWGGKAYLEKRNRNSNFKVLLERYAPRFSEEDEEEQVSFYRWPELSFNYFPQGKFDYALSLGRYYEDVSRVEGYRGTGRVRYNNRWWLTDNTYLKTTQILDGALYRMDEQEEILANSPYLVSYQSRYEQKTNFNRYLSWKNSYNFTGYLGESPFRFDRVNWQERLNSDINFHYQGFQFQLGGGYNFYQWQYPPLKGIIKWQINPSWQVGLGGSYDIETRDFGRLAFTSRYKNQNWEIDTALKFEPEERRLEGLENRLVYRLDEEWYFEANTGYEDDVGLKKANLLLKKNFHCRQLWFGYDFLKKEFSLEYRINLFPEKGFKVKSSEDTPFEMNLRELLQL